MGNQRLSTKASPSQKYRQRPSTQTKIDGRSPALEYDEEIISLTREEYKNLAYKQDIKNAIAEHAEHSFLGVVRRNWSIIMIFFTIVGGFFLVTKNVFIEKLQSILVLTIEDRLQKKVIEEITTASGSAIYIIKDNE